MPTIIIPDKICPHCCGTEWYFKPSKPTFYTCYSKRKESSKLQYNQNKNNPVIIAKKKKWMRNWRDSNKEHVRKYSLDYDKTEKGKVSKARRSSYAINELRDYYVRGIIMHNSSLLKEDIPQELIELQRKDLIMKRKVNISNVDSKKCIQCDNDKPLNKFETSGSVRCKACTSINYYYKNKEKISKKQAIEYKNRTEEEKVRRLAVTYEWRRNNPDKMKAANKRKYASVKANPEQYKKQLESSKKLHAERSYKECNQKYRDRSKENLTDNYIKRTFLSHTVKISYSDISQELVELKRKELQLTKQLNN